jgi:hypothetical protein
MSWSGSIVKRSDSAAGDVRHEPMKSGLIGCTGYVGSSLARQCHFDLGFSSRDIGTLPRHRYSLLVCAGAPAQKWLANRDPDGDLRALSSLFAALERVECERLVLVSTVDVFAAPAGVDEEAKPEKAGLHAYGRHRLLLEEAVRARFSEALIVRLPGLVGPGLRKNAVHDLHHGHELHAVDSRAVYQFYPMVRLWPDILTALAAGLRVLHLTAEPVSVADVARAGFGREFENHVLSTLPDYDLRTRHAALFGGRGAYQYSARESLLAIRAYAMSEPARGAALAAAVPR